MRSRLTSALLALVMLAATLGGSVVSAVAEEATATPRVISAPAAPLVPATLGVQIWPGAEAGVTAVLISVEVSSGVQLPARVRVPLPTGYELGWAGEISATGGEDVQRDVTIGEGEGGQYVEFVLSGSRFGQIDTSGKLFDEESGRFKAELGYVQTVESESVVFTVRMPANASDVAMGPEPERVVDTNEDGDKLYLLGEGSPKIGETQYVSITYGLKAASKKDNGSLTGPLIAALAVLVIIAIALVAALLRRGREDAYDAGELEAHEYGSESIAPPASGGPHADDDDPFQLDWED